MMRQMRDNMKWIMLATAVAFVGLMVFGWGMDITGRSAQATGGELGRVNGEPVSYEEWVTVYRSLYQQQQRANPGTQIDAATIRQLEDAAWQQIVNTKLIAQELRRRGIEVTAAEIREAARYAPPPEFMQNEMFQTNGQFDLNKYHQFLASPAVDQQLLLQLEAYYRDVIPRSKLFYQVTSGTYIPDSELWRIWRDARETARVRYIAIDPNRVVPDAAVSVSRNEIEAYYERNRADFKRPAQARLRYVSMDRAPTAADSARALERVRTVRQEALRDFAATAQRVSADSTSGAQGGSLGKLRRGQTVPAFEQAAFSLPVGHVSEPVLTQFGYHIVKVDSRTEDEAEVRHILIPIVRSTENEEQLLDRADSLETLGETQSLERAAQQLGLRVRTGELNENAPFLPAVGPADEAAQWIFREAEVGETSPVFETPSSYYMVEVLSRAEAGEIPLSQASAEIEQRLKAEKKLEQAKQFARTVVDRIRSGQTLEQAAQAANLRVEEAGPFTRLEFVPGLGRFNAATGTAFGLDPGQVSGAIEAEGMLFIIQTVEKKSAERNEFEQQKATQRPRLTQALAEQRWNQFLAALEENAKIVDNREMLQRQAAQQPALPAPF